MEITTDYNLRDEFNEAYEKIYGIVNKMNDWFLLAYTTKILIVMVWYYAYNMRYIVYDLKHILSQYIFVKYSTADISTI